MHEFSALLILVVAVALIFDFINGFHDTANAVATVISTRVLTPLAAVIMCGVLNFVGALLWTNVAQTISKGVISQSLATETVVFAAIIGAITWNLITWFFGIPSSSSHALIGGLMGAGMATGGTKVVLWNDILKKVIYPLVGSPVAGFVIGLLFMSLLTYLFARSNPVRTGLAFKRLQLLSSAFMSFAHGQNDGQKSMGIITLALVAHGMLPLKSEVPVWVKLACALAMGIGTASGGYRIIKTMGHKILRLDPVHGFAAETTGAAVIITASKLGMPVSTTHVIAGSIFGVGASRRLSGVRWGVALNMVTAWIITIPASATVAALVYFLCRGIGMHS